MSKCYEERRIPRSSSVVLSNLEFLVLCFVFSSGLGFLKCVLAGDWSGRFANNSSDMAWTVAPLCVLQCL